MLCHVVSRFIKFAMQTKFFILMVIIVASSLMVVKLFSLPSN
jgi:hypothetical protein